MQDYYPKLLFRHYSKVYQKFRRGAVEQTLVKHEMTSIPKSGGQRHQTQITSLYGKLKNQGVETGT